MGAIYPGQHIIFISIIFVSYRGDKSLELAVSSDLANVAGWRPPPLRPRRFLCRKITDKQVTVHEICRNTFST